MKQRITVEQLNELTDKQKERLQEWWNPQSYDVACGLVSGTEYVIDVHGDTISMLEDSEGIVPPIDKKEILPLLSIGQMIQLLREKHEIPFIKAGLFDWSVDGIERKELACALWEACKHVL